MCGLWILALLYTSVCVGYYLSKLSYYYYYYFYYTGIFSPHFFFIVTLSSHLYLLLYEDQKSHHSKVSVPSACLYYSFLQTWIIKSIKLQQSLLNICFLVFCCFLLTAHIVVITVMVMLLLCKICKNLVISTFFVCHLSLSLFIF